MSSDRRRSILNGWTQQQDHNLSLRKSHAYWLMIVLGGQAISPNVYFVLIGCGKFTFEVGTANTFMIAVFVDKCAMVAVVVRYRFPPPSDKLLELLDQFQAADRS